MQDPQTPPPVKITTLDTENPREFWELAEKLGVLKDRGYFEKALERQDKGELEILLAQTLGQPSGYCFLNWQPKYTYFKLHNIPEIQDLNVLRDFRNRGIGTAIISHCEGKARQKKYPQMGIGVGLDNSFGAAQRLYVRLGYIPDGNGISYDRKQVISGEFRPIDENLCLMMTKILA